MNKLFQSDQFDPTLNLAVEEALLLRADAVPALFLWQNAHTVVIGRGQNAWKECRSDLLKEEGGILVRRSTGGGAVYHDLGNLNFSFVMPKGIYDVSRQLRVIQRAVRGFGVETQVSGRNDIVIKESGAKFSGNAFRHMPDSSLHHGTILYHVDMQKLGRYLMPSEEKLRAKGVESVRSRVENLAPRAPGMDIASLKAALFEAFAEEYGPSEHVAWQEVLPTKQIEELQEKYRSWDWTFGRTPEFDISLRHRFQWGEAELLLSMRHGKVHRADCYTDANDPELAGRVSSLLPGAPFSPSALASALKISGRPEDDDIAAWLAEQIL